MLGELRLTSSALGLTAQLTAPTGCTGTLRFPAPTIDNHSPQTFSGPYGTPPHQPDTITTTRPPAS